ncbi:Xaa-Pro aminopeptidase 2 [Stylophora pistillata]|uniref:Xaa-Pro aminopeptidase 2 n=1 Tax=Stylophora pistillata TaxID=50429 RepID=A0A2B4S4C4_STYPI|nr:Xaa-Pro aminopeptidase 2 [Stylophora pistillata]
MGTHGYTGDTLVHRVNTGTQDAGLFVWGSNAFGQLGTGRFGGHLTTPAKSQSATPSLIQPHHHLSDGSVWSWGANKKGQLGIGKTGGNCSTPQQEDVRVFSWGRADYGQLGLGDEVVQLSFCSEPAEVVLVRGANQVLCGAEHNMALLDPTRTKAAMDSPRLFCLAFVILSFAFLGRCRVSEHVRNRRASSPALPKVNTTERLKQLREKMRAEGIQAYIIPSVDQHMSEYVAGHFERRPYISGFTGSAGKY